MGRFPARPVADPGKQEVKEMKSLSLPALAVVAAANIMSKYVPLPTNATNNSYSGFFTGPTDENEYLGKYDQVLSDRDRVALSYFYLKTTQNAFGNGNIPYTINQSRATQQVVNISDVHTLSPTTANQGWFNFTRVTGGRVNLPTGIGLDDLGSTFTTQGPKTLPNLIVSGYFSAGGALAGPVSDTDLYALRDMVSMIKGKHSLNFGGELSLEKDMIVGNLDNFGIFNFASSAPTTTGNALADFVTGQVSTMQQDTPYHGLLSAWYFAGFLEDNYRLLPRLTLNLGLRYDVQLSPVESSNLTATFVPGAQSIKVPSAPLGMLFPGDSGVPRGIADNRLHHVSPRVGIAWDPFGDGKTAIRAGAGIFYGSVSANEWNQPANAQPFAIRQTFNSIASLSNVYGNPASFPNGDPFPYQYSPASPRFLPAASIETIAENYQWPVVYQLNAAVQRQLPKNVSLTVAYVGTLSHHLPFMLDKNYAPYAPGASTSQASINARRPYDPGILGQVTYDESNETASYHSLQISASKAVLAESPQKEIELLAKMYLESPTREREVREARGRQAILQRMQSAFEAEGVWHDSRFFKNRRVEQYTRAGDPLRIDCGYTPNGSVKLFHAVSLATDPDSAKVLAFSFPQLAEGIARADKKKTELTAVTEDALDQQDESTAFALDILTKSKIKIVPVTEIDRIAKLARQELRI